MTFTRSTPKLWRCLAVAASVMLLVSFARADVEAPLSSSGSLQFDDPVQGMAISPDGTLLAVSSGLSSSTVDRGILAVYSTNPLRRVWSSDTPMPAHRCALVQNPRRLIALIRNEYQIWDFENRKLTLTKVLSDAYPFDLAIDDELGLAAIATADGKVMVVRLDTAEKVASLDHPGVNAIAFNGVRKELVSIGGQRIRKWSCDQWTTLQEAELESTGNLGVAACSNDGELFIAWALNGPLQIRSWTDLQTKSTLVEDPAHVGGAAFLSSKDLAVVPFDRELRLFEPFTGEILYSQEVTTKSISRIAVSRNGYYLASTGQRNPGHYRVELFKASMTMRRDE